MKLSIIVLVLAAVVISECGHTFMGTNVMRQLVYHGEAKYSSNLLRKRIEYFNFTMPHGRLQSIQGILAYDLTNTGASANVTSGGLGYNYMTLRMKSDRGKSLKYDIYIYV